MRLPDRPNRLSLRARLTWVFALAMTALLTGLGAFIYVRLSSTLLQGVDLDLGARADVLIDSLAHESGSSSLAGAGLLTGGHRFADPDEAFAQVLDQTGRILDSTPGASTAPLLSTAQATQITTANRPAFLTRGLPPPDDPERILAVPAIAAGRPVIAVLGATLGDRHDDLVHLLALYTTAGPAGLALACAAGWMMAGAALRPVEAIRIRAAQLSHANPGGRLPVPDTGDELARLTVTLNDLLARLHDAVAREHRFVDEASHELRTPLAVLKAELDLAAARPRTALELSATVSTAAVQTDRLITLAEDLLVLARARQQDLVDRCAPAHVPALVADAIEPLMSHAQCIGAAISVEVDDVVVRVDSSQISRAVRNLADNALRHGGGDVTVTARASASWLQIDITDRGPGIPGRLLPTIFDPFTHAVSPAATRRQSVTTVDDARSAEQRPGTGLGLAIVRAIAVAHGGSVTAHNRREGGTLIRLRLPREMPAPAVPTRE